MQVDLSRDKLAERLMTASANGVIIGKKSVDALNVVHKLRLGIVGDTSSSDPMYFEDEDLVKAMMEEIRRSPVEVGSLSHYKTGFYTSQLVVWDFFHQQ